MTRRSLRLAAVALAAALALPLAGCQNQQGTAAFVGGTRITSAEVDEQVDEFYEHPYWAKVAAGRRGEVRGRTMNTMLLLEVLERAAANEGVKVDQAQVDELVAQYEKEPTQIPDQFQGAPPALVAALWARVGAIQQNLQPTVSSPEELNAKFLEILRKAIDESDIQVNPRYGKFDSEQFSLNPADDKAVRDLPASPPPLPSEGGPDGQPQPGGGPDGQPQPGGGPDGQPQPEGGPEGQPQPQD